MTQEETLHLDITRWSIPKSDWSHSLQSKMEKLWHSVQFSSVQSLSRVWLFVTPWTVARQASLSITNSQSLPKLMSIESVMPSNHLSLCYPLFLLPSIFPNIRVFSNESVLCIRWPKCWSFSFNVSPSNEHSGLISFRMDFGSLCSPRDSQKSDSQQKQEQKLTVAQIMNSLWTRCCQIHT